MFISLTVEYTYTYFFMGVPRTVNFFDHAKSICETFGEFMTRILKNVCIHLKAWMSQNTFFRHYINIVLGGSIELPLPLIVMGKGEGSNSIDTPCYDNPKSMDLIWKLINRTVTFQIISHIARYLSFMVAPLVVEVQSFFSFFQNTFIIYSIQVLLYFLLWKARIGLERMIKDYTFEGWMEGILGVENSV